MSLYTADYSSKCKGKPVRQLPLRPSSVSRRNNPHPPRDFPDTQALQELKKDYSVETTLLARAKEKALSKKTWLDEMLAEKNNQSISSNVGHDLTEFRHVITKVREDKRHKEKFKTESSSKGCVHGYNVTMADHFA